MLIGRKPTRKAREKYDVIDLYFPARRSDERLMSVLLAQSFDKSVHSLNGIEVFGNDIDRRYGYVKYVFKLRDK